MTTPGQARLKLNTYTDRLSTEDRPKAHIRQNETQSPFECIVQENRAAIPTCPSCSGVDAVSFWPQDTIARFEACEKVSTPGLPELTASRSLLQSRRKHYHHYVDQHSFVVANSSIDEQPCPLKRIPVCSILVSAGTYRVQAQLRRHWTTPWRRALEELEALRKCRKFELHLRRKSLFGTGVSQMRCLKGTVRSALAGTKRNVRVSPVGDRRKTERPNCWQRTVLRRVTPLKRSAIIRQS